MNIFLIALVVSIVVFIIILTNNNKTTTQQQLNQSEHKREFNNQELALRLTEEIKKEYNKETSDLMLNGKVYLGMNERQFDQVLLLMFYQGKSSDKNPYPHRKETILKTKTKIIRSKSRRKLSGFTEYHFDNDKLSKIHTN